MYTDRISLYREIESHRNSKLLVYTIGERQGLSGASIGSDVLSYFTDHLEKMGKQPKISLLLHTRGGDTLAAYNLVNLIREFCDDFEVIIPLRALSAGTLISIGANRIIMTKQATLGPIDPSLSRPLCPQDPRYPQNPKNRVSVSVESINGFLQFIREDLKITNETNLKDILIDLSNQVHPLVLGDVYRKKYQIQMLAKKLLSLQLGKIEEDKIKKIIAFLCSDSGSHDYTIYKREAKEELGLNIEEIDDDLYRTIKMVMDDIRIELKLDEPHNFNSLLGDESTVNFNCRRVLIESLDFGTHCLVFEGTLTRDSQDTTQIHEQLKFDGWKVEKHGQF